jgi:glycosyltransferase involved in cell wall biosynthesis
VTTFSVVTVTYNYGRFLPDAMRSVRDQEGVGPVEHVVVDGGSTDETLEILGAASPEVCWISEPDEGQSDALNKGLAMATGAWVGWLNADEFYLPRTLAIVEETLGRHPDADVIFGDGVFCDEQGRGDRLMPARPHSRTMLRWGGPFPLTCTTFFRREALMRHRLDTTLRLIMDWDLFLKLDDAGARWQYTPAVLGAFKVHDVQATTAAERQTFFEEAYRIRPRLFGVVPWGPVRHLLRAVNRLQEVPRGVGRRERAFAAEHQGKPLEWWDDADARARADAVQASS